MTEPERILRTLGDHMQQIKGFGARKVGLFGSYLRNEQTNESDVDILVEFETGQKTFDHYMDLKFFLEDLLGARVDLVIAEALKPDIKPHVLRSVKYAAGA
jgi:predicted nucleotidyltransferase